MIDSITKNFSANKGGFKDLIRAVVLSESFMNIARLFFLELVPLPTWRASFLLAAEPEAGLALHGQGTRSGKVTDSTALPQKRLPLASQLDPTGTTHLN